MLEGQGMNRKERTMHYRDTKDRVPPLRERLAMTAADALHEKRLNRLWTDLHSLRDERDALMTELDKRRAQVTDLSVSLVCLVVLMVALVAGLLAGCDLPPEDPTDTDGAVTVDASHRGDAYVTCTDAGCDSPEADSALPMPDATLDESRACGGQGEACCDADGLSWCECGACANGICIGGCQ
jgi:hypothetical protein